MIGSNKHRDFALAIDEHEFRSIRVERVLYPNGQALVELRRRDANDESAGLSL